MENNVQGTNDSSILSKYSMTTSGYFKDDFIKYFIERPVKRAPLINIGYFVRASIIHSSLSYYCTNISDQAAQIISLGAGFDTTFFQLASNYSNIKYIEIDLPGVVNRKIDIIRNCEHLKKKISEVNDDLTVEKENEILSKKYCIFSHDLSKLDGLELKLKNCGIDFKVPTLLFSECAITYLEEEKSTELIRWSNTLFKSSTFLIFEQINPDDAFGYVMKSHFNKIQSPLKSVNKYKTIREQIQRFISCGWHWCEGVSAVDMIINLFPPEILWQKLKTEPFDEFEEWHLKCCHYSLVIATKTEYASLWDKFVSRFGKNIPTRNTKIPSLNWEEIQTMEVNRFGHCGLIINDKSYFLFGGFGSIEKKHSRVKTILQISLNEFKITTLLPDVKEMKNQTKAQEMPIWDCMYSTSTKLNENMFLLYGGRLSPNKPVNTKPWLCKINWSECNKTNIVPVFQVEHIGQLEPLPRWRHSSVLISPTKVLIYGGLTVGLEVLNDLWLLNITSNSGNSLLCWTLIHPEQNGKTENTPPPSFSHSAATFQNTMYISGGFNNSLLPLNQLWSYRFSDGWQKLETIPELKPRYSHTSHVTENKQLLLLGGVNINFEDQPGLAVICLETLTVTEFDILTFSGSNLTALMLHNHTSIYREKDKSLYITGGGGNCFSFGTYFNPYVVRLRVPLQQKP